jgi:ribosomal protein S27E
MKLFYFLVLICCLACSKKTSKFTISGKINDSSLNQNLSNATISIYKKLQGNSFETFIASTTTNSEGNYSFTFDRDKSEKYTLKISKENYFPIEESILFSSLTVDGENVRNYSTTAKSWARLHFKNIDPKPEDQLRFMKQQGKVSCNECCPTDYQYIYGASDTSIYCINDGNTIYSFIYAVIGTQNQALKSILTIPFDTTEIYLEY